MCINKSSVNNNCQTERRSVFPRTLPLDNWNFFNIVVFSLTICWSNFRFVSSVTVSQNVLFSSKTFLFYNSLLTLITSFRQLTPTIMTGNITFIVYNFISFTIVTIHSFISFLNRFLEVFIT